MEQQRLMAQDQVKVMQDRQSSMMKQQQSQMEIMLKQIQAQMETEMRMKSDLVSLLDKIVCIIAQLSRST